MKKTLIFLMIFQGAHSWAADAYEDTFDNRPEEEDSLEQFPLNPEEEDMSSSDILSDEQDKPPQSFLQKIRALSPRMKKGLSLAGILLGAYGAKRAFGGSDVQSNNELQTNKEPTVVTSDGDSGSDVQSNNELQTNKEPTVVTSDGDSESNDN